MFAVQKALASQVEKMQAKLDAMEAGRTQDMQQWQVVTIFWL